MANTVTFGQVFTLNGLLGHVKGATKNMNTLMDVRRLEKFLSDEVEPMNAERVKIAKEYFQMDDKGNTIMDDEAEPVPVEGKDKDEGMKNIETILEQEIDLGGRKLRLRINMENMQYNGGQVEMLAGILGGSFELFDQLTKEAIDVSLFQPESYADTQKKEEVKEDTPVSAADPAPAGEKPATTVDTTIPPKTD